MSAGRGERLSPKSASAASGRVSRRSVNSIRSLSSTNSSCSRGPHLAESPRHPPGLHALHTATLDVLVAHPHTEENSAGATENDDYRCEFKQQFWRRTLAVPRAGDDAHSTSQTSLRTTPPRSFGYFTWCRHLTVCASPARAGCGNQLLLQDPPQARVGRHPHPCKTTPLPSQPPLLELKM